MSKATLQTVAEDDNDIRIDRWFKRHYPSVPFSRLSKAFRKGEVRLDGSRVKGNERIEAGQEIRVPPLGDGAMQVRAKEPPKTLDSETIALVRSWVLHMDDDVIVLNKPAGLATQGGTGITKHLDGMLSALQYDRPSKPKLVHRLDKDTSGVLLLGRSSNAAAYLAKAFQTNATDKRYWALVSGVPKEYQGRIKLLMDKVQGPHGDKMRVTETGKKSLTDYAMVDRAAMAASWLALKPHTGRTHQLRLHCAEMGHPIIGDGKYGGDLAYLTGSISKKLHLHAQSIHFPHPKGGVMDVRAPLPPHMRESFETLGFDIEEYEDPFEDIDP